MREKLLRVGISTCPNDTFAFHAILCAQIDQRGLQLDIELLDVQQLNDRMLAGDLDVAKVSFHAALLAAEQTVVLPAGSALGFGVGPVMLATENGRSPEDRFPDRPGGRAIVLCPGTTTTATLLYRMFYPHSGQVHQAVFSQIMPQLKEGSADFGICIHEGRFTYQQQGLHLVADLGARWELATGVPLPLGGIVARRELGSEYLQRLHQLILDSIQFGLANRKATLPTLRRYAQELDDDVLFAHVDLYVNRWTEDLGPQGRRALSVLSDLARQQGIVAADSRGLEVF